VTSAGDDGVSRRLRSLPSVERVVRALGPDAPPPPIATAVARLAVDRARARVRAGESLSFEEIESDAVRLLETRSRARLSKIINATGVLIHTNLGRSPLGEKQMEAVQRVASGYSNLEYDIDAGRRGSRYAHARAPLVALTGAQSALVVNNCAAALLLTLTGLCKEREVIISRGELVEIGGEFRIPDVLAASGARLKEIGTTNRTHLIDYERAIGPETGAILKVHPSNYKMLGFTAAVEARALARLARGRGVLFINDLGSGLINSPSHAPWLEREPTVEAAVADGADIVTFSGDKLLGGPQAGMIVGRSELIDTLARHPLLRALRVDKMTLAALEATFEILLRGTLDELPLWRMATASLESLEGRARALAGRLAPLTDQGVKIEAIASRAVTGGGSLPGEDIGSWAIALVHPERSVDELERALRTGDGPVIARIEDDRLLIDLRAVAPADDDALAASVLAALSL